MRSNVAGSDLDGGRGTPQEGYLSRHREPLPTRVQDLAPLPDAFREALDAGVATLDLHLTPDQRLAIETHVRLLMAWSGAINLTAIREPVEIARRHVVDSLAAVPVLRDLGVSSFLDLGSGAGFPGLPLAIALPGRAHLVDSVGKKTAFLRAAIAAAGVRDVAVETARSEDLAAQPSHRERWDAVTARAVAGLGDLVELAFPLMRVGGVLVAWKRGDLDPELAAGRRAAEALGGGGLRVVDPALPDLPDHRLVVLRKLAPTPPGWPRDPAARRRRPW